MKTLLSLTLAALALNSITAMADDPQLKNRLAMERASKETPATIALYTDKHGLGSPNLKEEASVRTFEQRINAHGEMFTAHSVAK